MSSVIVIWLVRGAVSRCSVLSVQKQERKKGCGSTRDTRNCVPKVSESRVFICCLCEVLLMLKTLKRCVEIVNLDLISLQILIITIDLNFVVTVHANVDLNDFAIYLICHVF